MNSSYYRERARQMLFGKWGMAVLVTLIAGILGGLMLNTSTKFNLELDAETIKRAPKIIRTYLTAAVGIGGTLAVVQFIISGVIQLGYCQYLLKLYDGKDGELKDLFSQFHRFADGFILSLLSGIYIFLWSLLFIIPGIVAAYKYAMAPFILLENPGLSADEAIAASKEMMYGHKGDLFLLDLSFIGWSLLCVLTLGIGNLWLNPYMNAAYAAFYRELSPAPCAPGIPIGSPETEANKNNI